MLFKLEKFISKEYLTEFCKQYYIRKFAIYGSALHDQLRLDSDIDILVEFDENHVPGLFTIARMENVLSEKIGRKVDLRTPEDLSHYFRDDVVRQAEVQYAL